jgi:hypothetical protein
LNHRRHGRPKRVLAQISAPISPWGTMQRLLTRILEKMKPARAATRRFLPTSPFKPPPDEPPPEVFAVQDQVTHDKYGLGRVVTVEDDTAVVVDFGTQRVRIATPCAKLSKL